LLPGYKKKFNVLASVLMVQLVARPSSHLSPPIASGRAQPSGECTMKRIIAALALASMIAIPTLTVSANAAAVSPASSAFGDNGY
jgi:hypothetical protein